MKARWPAAALLAFLFVLGCTLFPFQFSLDQAPGQRLSDALFIEIGPDRGLDVLTNVLLFLPFGIALAWFLEQKRLRPARVIATVAFASVCVSYAIEVLQQFIPGRFSSLTDVASNTAGGVVGAIYYVLWRTGQATSRRAASEIRTEHVHGSAVGTGSVRGKNSSLSTGKNSHD